MFLFSFPRDHVPVKLAAKRVAVSMSSASSSEASLSFPLSLSTASSSDASGKLTISQFLESVLHVVQLPRQARAASVSVRSAPSLKGMKSKKDKKTRSRPSNTLRFSLEDAVAAKPFKGDLPNSMNDSRDNAKPVAKPEETKPRKPQKARVPAPVLERRSRRGETCEMDLWAIY